MFRFWICCFILKKQTNTLIVFIMFQYITLLWRARKLRDLG